MLKIDMKPPGGPLVVHDLVKLYDTVCIIAI